MHNNERRPSVGSTWTTLASRRNSALLIPPVPQRELPQPRRTPFRSVRPVTNGNVNQLQYSINVCVEQLRKFNKTNTENKKSLATTNRRITDLENTVSHIETKIDQLLLMFKQKGPTKNGANNCSSVGAHSTGGYATTEEIVPRLRIPSEALSLTHRKSHGPVIFLELFGPMRTRLKYNWDGTKESP